MNKHRWMNAMKITNFLFQGDRTNPSKIRNVTRPMKIPDGMTFYDLCDYVNALYFAFETAYKRFLETKEETFALIAIDTLLAINQIERMKDRLAQQIYNS